MVEVVWKYNGPIEMIYELNITFKRSFASVETIANTSVCVDVIWNGFNQVSFIHVICIALRLLAFDHTRSLACKLGLARSRFNDLQMAPIKFEPCGRPVRYPAPPSPLHIHHHVIEMSTLFSSSSSLQCQQIFWCDCRPARWRQSASN